MASTSNGLTFACGVAGTSLVSAREVAHSFLGFQGCLPVCGLRHADTAEIQGRGWVLARCATMCLGVASGARTRKSRMCLPRVAFRLIFGVGCEQGWRIVEDGEACLEVRCGSRRPCPARQFEGPQVRFGRVGVERRFFIAFFFRDQRHHHDVARLPTGARMELV